MSNPTSPFPVDVELLSAAAREVRWSCGQSVRPPYELTPHQYLSFAEEDLQDACLRGRLNALHNAKRAIGVSIDSALWNFGLGRSIGQAFPAKMELVRSLGLLSPRIIAKVLRSRNLVEHRYASVSTDEAEDAVDIATLFVATLQPFSHYRYDDLELFLPDRLEGVVIWTYDGDCDDGTFERNSGREANHVAPTAIYYEFYRRVGGSAGNDGVFQGPRSTRRSAEWLMNERGVLEVGAGFIRPEDRNLYTTCAALFVRAAQNCWLWREDDT